MDLMSRAPLASIPVRLAAVLLDGLLAMAIAIPVMITGYVMSLGLTATPPSFASETMLTFGLFILILTCVGFASYSALVLALWAYGLTPGKWLLGIRIVNHDAGTPAGFWRVALREVIGKWVSAVVCYLGYIWAIFDAQKQAWHDKIAKTLVVRTR